MNFVEPESQRCTYPHCAQYYGGCMTACGTQRKAPKTMNDPERYTAEIERLKRDHVGAHRISAMTIQILESEIARLRVALIEIRDNGVELAGAGCAAVATSVLPPHNPSGAA